MAKSRFVLGEHSTDVQGAREYMEDLIEAGRQEAVVTCRLFGNLQSDVMSKENEGTQRDLVRNTQRAHQKEQSNQLGGRDSRYKWTSSTLVSPVTVMVSEIENWAKFAT